MLNKIALSSALLIIITTTVFAYTVSYDFEQSVQADNWAAYNSKDNEKKGAQGNYESGFYVNRFH